MINPADFQGSAVVPSFDPTEHRYWIKGREVPSVSLVIESLTDWSAIPPAVLARKATLGSAVHLACALHDEGDLDDASVSPEIRGYLDGYISAIEMLGMRPMMVEQPIASSLLGFAGTPDRVFAMPDDSLTLVDIKTALVESPAWRVQLSAYRLLLLEAGICVRTIAALRLTAEGCFKWDEVEYSGNDEICFRSLLNVHEWKALNV